MAALAVPVPRSLLERLAWPALVVASVLYRLPPLLNAAGTNSDAAIVGLQAMHLLRGEWSWFLHGSGYQTSVDSQVAALFFVAAGPSPLALMLSTFCGHLLLTWFALATLRRHLSGRLAALAVLPLVFTPGPLHTYILYPPRQASLTLAFAAIWVLDGAGREALAPPPGASPETAGARSTANPREAARAGARLAGGMALASLACFADPYAMLFVPPIGLFGLLLAFDALPSGREAARRAGAVVAGGLVGAVPFWLLVHSAGASRGQIHLTTEVMRHNLELLRGQCLPWILSLAVFHAPAGGDYDVWKPPAAVVVVQVAGAVALVAGVAFAGLAAGSKRLRWGARRLGILGLAAVPVTLGGFLTSVMVMDFFSTRYLAALVLMAPFALAPAALRLGARAFAAALLPYLVSAGIAGWVHYGSDVEGLSIRTEGGEATDERALGALLRARGIRYGVADYWASYRLTFLFREDPILVPTNEAEDRYLPYRQAFAEAAEYAYVFDPRRSREDLAAALRSTCAYPTSCERLEVGRFTVVLVGRAALALEGPAPASRLTSR